MKTITTLVLAFAFLIAAVPASAATGSLTSGGDGSAIACVKAAVATREAKLATGWATFSDTTTEAYSDRAAALAEAYSSGHTRAEVKAEVKTAWKAFKDTVKKARADWKKTRNDAHKAHKAAAKACKAPAEIDDSANASAEAGA